MNFKPKMYNSGKTCYWINYKSFENDANQRNGREKAEKYCLDNFLNPADIQKFDSRTERDYYEHLLELEKNKLITNLGHHFTLKIQDEFINSNGDPIPSLTYEADFIYYDIALKRREVVDIKGSEYFIDERFLTIKQIFDKLMLNKGLYIKVVLKRNNEWVEWHIGEKKKSQKLIKKQREDLKEIKKHQHDKLMKENAMERDKKRYIELSSKVKLTKKENERFNFLKKKLVENGIIINEVNYL